MMLPRAVARGSIIVHRGHKSTLPDGHIEFCALQRIIEDYTESCFMTPRVRNGVFMARVHPVENTHKLPNRAQILLLL